MTTTMLQEGDIVELQEGHKVYATVPKHFLYENCEGCCDVDKGAVVIGGELAYLKGRYVVYKTGYDGGSGAGGRDDYPGGHHVFCERLDDRGVQIDFYQSGSFTAMIEDLHPVGKAVRTWSER